MANPLRVATPADIVCRLTGTLYKSTAETALGGGMGDAQLGIATALGEAIDAGLVRVVSVRDTTYGRGIRFVTLAEGVHYCRTCIVGCDCEIGTGGCAHRGCWGAQPSLDCPGRAFAQHPLADEHAPALLS